MEIANLQAVISVETGRFRAGMAGVDAQLRGTAAEMRAVDQRTRASAAAMAGFGQKSALARAGAMGLKVGLAAVGVAAYEGFKRMKDQERVSAMTANTLKNTANAAGLTQGKVERLAGSLALMTGVSKHTVQGAENILLGFKNVTRDSGTFRQVLQASMDRSAKSGRDLINVTRAIGMAFNDPIGGMGRLARAGIFLDSTTKSNIKEMAKAGKVDEARALILDKVASSAKGAAAALGQTTTGQLNRMKEALGQMEEEVAAALLPALLSLGPPLIELVHALAPAFKGIAAVVGDVVAPVAAMATAVLNNKAALVALTAVLGTLLAMNVATRVMGMASAFNQMAAATAGTKIVGGVASLIGTVGSIGGAFVSAATGVGSFAQKATVFDKHVATAGRFAGAMGAAKTSMSAFGAAASSAMGGPWVVAAVAGVTAVSALAVAIGPSLVESFMGAGSATDQYGAALQNANTASQNLMASSGAMKASLLTYTEAAKAEAQARQAAAAAGGNDAAANARLSAAIARTDQVRGAAHAGLSSYIDGLRGSSRAVQDTTTKLANAVAPLGMVDVKTKEGADAWRRHEQAVRLAQQSVGNTAAFKNQQAELGRLGDYLKGLGPKYAGVAKAAADAAKMKPGEAQTKAVEKLMGDLSRLDNKVKGTSPTIKVKADGSQAQKVVDGLKAKLDSMRDKTITVTVQQRDLTTGQAGLGTATREGSRSMEGPSYDDSRATYRRSPANAANVAGTFQVPPGILDLIASLKQAGRESVNANAATAAALALNSALSKQAQVANLASRVASTLGAFTSAKTDKEKAAAKSQAVSALTALYLASGQDSSKKAARAHAAATLGLVAAHKLGAKAATANARKTAAKAAQDATVAAVGWQDQLQAELDDVLAAANAATPAVNGVAGAVSGLDDAASAASSNLSKAQSLVEKAMQKVRDTLTPTEAAIKSLQDTWASQDIAQSVADAQDALRNAMDFGDADAIRNAQKALEQASRQQRIAELQPLATAERQTVNDFLDNLDPAAIAQQLVDNGGNIAAGATINLTVTDNTFAGLSRDQADRIALSIQAAISRRVGISI